ncbi:MAG: hypothetical protein KQH63_02580 [Desulfobulbaceae bacterium]|nr:hypothetical protein [Desulfobulbaceae bacterium]
MPFRKKTTTAIIITIIATTLLMFAGCADKKGGTPEMLEPGMYFVKGKIKKVSLEKGKITIKPPKGDRVKLFINENTELKDYSSVESIQKDQPVEAVYKEAEGKNIAISIKQLPQGSCQ